MFHRDSYQPIEKPKRIKDRKAIKVAKTDCCEVCFARFGRSCLREVHHIKTRGSGGNDLRSNLICLCQLCHRKVHNGEISRARLLEIKRRGNGEAAKP